MPPRLNIAAFARPIAFRPKRHVQWPARSALGLTPSQFRLSSDSTKPPAADRSKREDAKPIEHVSEEAASMAQTMGGEGPDLSQGTPVEDVRSIAFIAHGRAHADGGAGCQRRQGGTGDAAQGDAGQAQSPTVQSDTKRRAKRIAIILDHDDSNKRRGRAGHGPGRRAQGVDSASDTRLEI